MQSIYSEKMILIKLIPLLNKYLWSYSKNIIASLPVKKDLFKQKNSTTFKLLKQICLYGLLFISLGAGATLPNESQAVALYHTSPPSSPGIPLDLQTTTLNQHDYETEPLNTSTSKDTKTTSQANVKINDTHENTLQEENHVQLVSDSQKNRSEQNNCTDWSCKKVSTIAITFGLAVMGGIITWIANKYGHSGQTASLSPFGSLGNDTQTTALNQRNNSFTHDLSIYTYKPELFNTSDSSFINKTYPFEHYAKNDAHTSMLLAESYLQGTDGKQKNYKEAFSLLKESSDKNNLEAQATLIDLYEKFNLYGLFPMLEKAAKEGSSEASFRLAKIAFKNNNIDVAEVLLQLTYSNLELAGSNRNNPLDLNFSAGLKILADANIKEYISQQLLANAAGIGENFNKEKADKIILEGIFKNNANTFILAAILQNSGNSDYQEIGIELIRDAAKDFSDDRNITEELIQSIKLTSKKQNPVVDKDIKAGPDNGNFKIKEQIALDLMKKSDPVSAMVYVYLAYKDLDDSQRENDYLYINNSPIKDKVHNVPPACSLRQLAIVCIEALKRHNEHTLSDLLQNILFPGEKSRDVLPASELELELAKKVIRLGKESGQDTALMNQFAKTIYKIIIDKWIKNPKYPKKADYAIDAVIGYAQLHLEDTSLTDNMRSVVALIDIIKSEVEFMSKEQYKKLYNLNIQLTSLSLKRQMPSFLERLNGLLIANMLGDKQANEIIYQDYLRRRRINNTTLFHKFSSDTESASEEDVMAIFFYMNKHGITYALDYCERLANTYPELAYYLLNRIKNKYSKIIVKPFIFNKFEKVKQHIKKQIPQTILID